MSDVRLTLDLTDALTGIAHWYPGTEDPPRTTMSTTHVVYGSKPPIRTDVLSLRRQTTDTLTSYALLVCEERDLHTTLHGDDVPALTRFLAAHAEWLAGFDTYAPQELRHLAHLLEQVVRQTMPARVKQIAPCPEDGCGGILEAVVRRDDDLLPSNVHCDGEHHHTWPPHQWLALGRRASTFLGATG
jgi:hypothetical protein